MLYGNSAFSLWVVTDGLLELMSTGELISRECRSVGECTIRLRVFKAVVIENCFMLFLLDSDRLQKAGDSMHFALGKDLRKGEDCRLLLDWRTCRAVILG